MVIFGLPRSQKAASCSCMWPITSWPVAQLCLTSKKSTFGRRQPLCVGARYVDSMLKALWADECGMAQSWSYWGISRSVKKAIAWLIPLKNKESCFTVRVDTVWPKRLWSLCPWRYSNSNWPWPWATSSTWLCLGKVSLRLETFRSPSNLCSSVTWWSVKHVEVMRTTD